jgi:predicted nuclease of predicted toxin-antitoxin system
VKLLFDENLSHHLVGMLEELFPGSVHVRDIGLKRADDVELWRHAAEHGHAIVSKDEDFAERALLSGPPPKVIWIRLGNCSTAAVEALFRDHRTELLGFSQRAEAGLLVIP